MERLVDKAVLALACCVLAFVPGIPEGGAVAVLLVGIACSAAVELGHQSGWLRRVVALGLVAGALALPADVGILLPLSAYDLARERRVYVRLAWLVCLVRFLMLPTLSLQLMLTCAVAGITSLVSLRTGSLLQRESELHDLRDDLQERILQLDASRRELELARDEQTHAATLAERTRISREIHDSVGHLLTRSILQVQALEVVHEAEPNVASDLADVRATLDEALTVTRRSVHAMADNAFDLRNELHRLAQGSPIEQVDVAYDLDAAPPAELSRTMLALCREALTNAARHAHAACASVRLTEYPGLWQLSVTNDGQLPRLDPALDAADQLATRGMGVRSMQERVLALGGTFRITCEDSRFVVFASFPRRR